MGYTRHERCVRNSLSSSFAIFLSSFFFFSFLNSHHRLLTSVASFNDNSPKLNKYLFMTVTVFM